MMNESKVITMILRRMFSKKYFRPLAGVRSKIQITEKTVDLENFDSEDLSEFEADFMNVNESHKMHERAMQRNKEHLKQQIVMQKYFKENEPRFITFAERQLICKLYKSNPEEWTIERLSESFPVLPETVQKILQSNWSPKSVERVKQYDDKVVENWKNFRAGKLSISPRLNEHLLKFKNRKIILTDRELFAKQFVQPEPKFKKPKSQLFSNIIQSYIDEKQNDKKLLSQKDNPCENQPQIEDEFAHSNKNQNLLITDNKTESNSVAIKNPEKSSEKQYLTLNSHTDNKTESNSVAIKNPEKSSEKQYLTLNSHTDSEKHDILLNKKNNIKKLFTFDEFVKAKLKDIQKESPEEGITLLNLYKKEMEASQEIISNNAISSRKKDKLKTVQNSNNNVSAVSENNSNSNTVMADDNLIGTSIKVWNKKIDTEYDYAKPIKISKDLYKPGMTYRISDCYYDDDGTFLYRVPGVQS